MSGASFRTLPAGNRKMAPLAGGQKAKVESVDSLLANSVAGARLRPPETTLLYAKQWRDLAGIGEVAEITRLDTLGVPVFVSTRPGALADVFTFGKGREPVDAEVAAYMEAIEYYFAEPGSGCVATRWGTAREIAGGEESDQAILDYAPMFGRSADLDAPLLLASVHDIETGAEAFLPAELVHYPAPDVGQILFGSSTTGLASGNSILEASYQALAELIERDIWSFEFVRPNSILVDSATLPEECREIISRAKRAGLELKVRTILNEFGLPFFAVFLFDSRNPTRKFFNGGWACDLDRSVALMRAVTEAAQSRLAFLHGGRGEPAKLAFEDAAGGEEEEAALLAEQIQLVSDETSTIPYSRTPDLAVDGELGQRFDALMACLRRVTNKPVYRAAFTPPDAPLHVVRLIAPLLENFKEKTVRIGPRLKAAIDASAGEELSSALASNGGSANHQPDPETSVTGPRETYEIRIRGTVQGVGFRPTVWRLAHDEGLVGEVLNDGSGVLITATASESAVSRFLNRLRLEAPPLAETETVETRRLETVLDFDGFHIIDSAPGENRTRVTPDAAVCPACRDEVLNPLERRHRYPFANCTHCGPRFSIVKEVPYDRARTTMAAFPMCDLCAAEYADPANRRFHAQPIACASCGPGIWFETESPTVLQADAIDATVERLQRGGIIAIRGLGGFHLACDATDTEAVQRLRHRKRRYGKPFALMARDIDVIRRYCTVTELEQRLLESAEAPIVLLAADGPDKLPPALAPGLNTLGFMLPYTPLHLLLLRDIDHPLVMTSGNLSDEPQVTEIDAARTRLDTIADAVLMHNRDIANRIDDSVVRVMAEKPRLLRRARGYAPSAIRLPQGFENAPGLLAFGGELKATFCLLKDGAAILSQHQGDLEDAATFEDYQKNLRLYTAMYQHQPRMLVADLHPEYLSSKLARECAESAGLPLAEIQHHHAHVASCMAENGVALDAPPVLGIALDGLGYGDDGSIWGGEFLLADYRGYQRLATFKPVAMIGGAQAIREPWRNTYAHLSAALGWPHVSEHFSSLDICRLLSEKPLPTIDRMIERGINSPLATSCGRLFDAVAAALGFCPDRALFEGQGAMELESAAEAWISNSDAGPCPFSISSTTPANLPSIDPTPMWQALMEDLSANAPAGLIAARFHHGLARAIAEMIRHIRSNNTAAASVTQIALTGGCFQNKILLEQVQRKLEAAGLTCLLHAKVPANDGGLALGQAAIAAARRIAH